MTEIIVPMPDDLKLRAEAAANQNGIPLEQFVKLCVEASVERRSADPLFANIEVWEGDTPSDLSERHDDYLYGENA
jgi:hypothetical protein